MQEDKDEHRQNPKRICAIKTVEGYARYRALAERIGGRDA